MISEAGEHQEPLKGGEEKQIADSGQRRGREGGDE